MPEVTVTESGLVISKSYPWLCASPDGIIIDRDGKVIVLEIKCRVSGKVDVDYIKEGKLKKGHPYFSQVQIQMFCCGADLCHFYIYGDKDNTKLVKVPREDPFI